MGELLQQKLEQAGIAPEQFSIDIWELYREVTVIRSDSEDKYRNLSETYIARQTENWPRPYIDPSHAETTEDDVRAAFRFIRHSQKMTQKGGRSRRNQEVAVQCAILYDQRNYTDPEEKRRWKWTHKTLAEKFGLPSERSAKYHVELGRMILEKKENRVR
jgi:hypothetical protein